MASPAPELIHVLVVDDDLFVRGALSSVIGSEPRLQLVGAVGNGRQAVDTVAEQHVDVVLMDVQLPVLDGISATRMIRERHPGTRVLLLTSFDDDSLIRSGMASGASGYLLKSTPADAIGDIVRAVACGANVMSPHAIDQIVAPGHPAPPEDVSLTPAESAVLRLLVEGLSNSEIAAALFVSESTVKNRISSVASKLKTTSRVSTAVRAIQWGLA